MDATMGAWDSMYFVMACTSNSDPALSPWYTPLHGSSELPSCITVQIGVNVYAWYYMVQCYKTTSQETLM